jgi:hypothetical protein
MTVVRQESVIQLVEMNLLGAAPAAINDALLGFLESNSLELVQSVIE